MGKRGRPKKGGVVSEEESANAFQVLTELQDIGLSHEEIVDLLLKVKDKGMGIQKGDGGKRSVPLIEAQVSSSGSKSEAVTPKGSGEKGLRWANVVEEEEGLPIPPGVPQHSWADITRVNRDPQNGFPLEYVKPAEVIKFSLGELQEGAKVWSNTLIGMVVGASPSYLEVLKYVRTSWKDMGLGRTHQMRRGIFMFEFKSEEDRAKVLEGRWAMNNRFPLLLKPWQAGVSVDEHFDRIPVWIQLPHLNLDMWSPANLSKVASYVGVPITTDAFTAARSRIDYARVLVEVQFGRKLPEVIPMQCGDGPVFHQAIVYEWKPVTCNECGWFGHDQSKCRRKSLISAKEKEDVEVKGD